MFPYLPAFAGAVAIACVQLFVARMTFFERAERRWVAFSAGVAIAYVFLDILPHLASAQVKLQQAKDGGVYGYLEHHAYLLALAGFVLFLGVVLAGDAARDNRLRSETRLKELPVSTLLRGVAFAGYSFLIGYILQEHGSHRRQAVALFAAAMTIHFAGLSHLLRARTPGMYQRHLRWWVVVALLAGWGTGAFVGITDATFAMCFAFLAGAVIVVASAHEVPGLRESRRYLPFVAGATVFTGLLLMFELLRDW